MTFTKAQQAVVAAVVDDVLVPGWERVLVDVEIAEQPDGFDLDTVSIVISRNAERELEDGQFHLGQESKQAIVRLYKERQLAHGDVIGSFQLKIDRTGTYGFQFSYDPPSRLNGVWNQEHQRWLDDYLAAYKVEIGET